MFLRNWGELLKLRGDLWNFIERFLEELKKG